MEASISAAVKDEAFNVWRSAFGVRRSAFALVLVLVLVLVKCAGGEPLSLVSI
jgi:hypothetical protein